MNDRWSPKPSSTTIHFHLFIAVSMNSFLPTYNPTASPKTAAPTAIPIPAVTCAPPPVLPALPVWSAAATCNPYPVVVITVPLIVLVTTLVAVVRCVQLDHDAHGAFVFQAPAVQPGQSEGGHALPPHHAVQGPLRQSERVDQSE